MGDLKLVQLYARRRDAEAFAELVRRYQTAVWAVCRRSCFEPADADDATQEVFLRLAQRAGELRGNIGAWLHRCAVNVCTDLNRKRSRRRAHEARLPASNGEDRQAMLAELREHVDTAMVRIGEPHRELLVQRYYLGRQQAEMASEMAISPSTITRRIEQAIAALRHELEAMGGITAISVAGLLEQALSTSAEGAAVPAGLSANLMKIGMSGAGVASGGIMASWLVKVAAAVLLLGGIGVAIIAATAAGDATARQGSAEPASPQRQDGVPAFVENAAPGAQDATVDWTMPRPLVENAVLSGRILDESGKPISGATVTLTGGGQQEQSTLTDQRGGYAFETVAAPGEYRLGVRADQYVELRWFDSAAPRMQLAADTPMRRDVVIQRGATVEVTVIDEEDQLLGEVSLDVTSDQLPSPQPNWMSRTDEGGFCEYTLPMLNGHFRIDAVKKGYAPASSTFQIESLDRVHEVALVLRKGQTVTGTATCKDGAPAHGYEIELRPEGWQANISPGKASVDDTGRFVLAGVLPGRNGVWVWHRGTGRMAGTVEVIEGKPLQIDLPFASVASSKAVSGKVLFGGDKPAEHVTVTAYGRGLHNHLYGRYQTSHELGEGTYQFESMPADVYRIEFEARGYSYKVLDNVKIPGEIPPVQLTRSENPHIVGHVVDAATGEPVEHYAVRVRKLRTIGDGPNYGQKTDWTQVSDRQGRFRQELVGPGAYQVQVSAHGYAWIWSEALTVNEEEDANVAFRLTRGGQITGTVLDATSRPVVDAKVIPFSKARSISMSHKDHFDGEAGAVTTDKAGRFVLECLAPGEERLRVVHRDFAPLDVAGLRVEEGQRTETGELRLLVGGSVQGTVYDRAGWPAAGVPLELRDDFGYGDDSVISRVTTDENGFYSFEHLSEMNLFVDVQQGWEREGVVRRQVRPREGRTAIVDMGGKNAIPGIVRDDAGPMARKRLVLAAGSPHFGQRAYATTEADGRFTFRGIPSGRYVLWHLSGDSDFNQLAEVHITDRTTDLGTLTREVGDFLVQLEADDGVDLSTVHVRGMAARPDQVWVDDAYRAQPVEGRTNCWRMSGVRAGPVRVTASADWGSISVQTERKAGVAEIPLTIRVPAATGQVKVHFDTQGAAMPAYATLFSETWPMISAVVSEGSDIAVRLPPGFYRVVMGSKITYDDHDPRVEVRPGEIAEVTVRWRDAQSDPRVMLVSVWSADGVRDLAADVRVTNSDGKVMPSERSDTPGETYQLPPGRYRVVAEADGKIVAQKEVEPEADDSALPMQQRVERIQVRLYRQ